MMCRGRFYPGTGGADEVGLGAGEGFTVNVPWAAKDMGNGDYIAAFHQVLVPIAYEFNPDLIIVSAGELTHLLRILVSSIHLLVELCTHQARLCQTVVKHKRHVVSQLGKM